MNQQIDYFGIFIGIFILIVGVTSLVSLLTRTLSCKGVATTNANRKNMMFITKLDTVDVIKNLSQHETKDVFEYTFDVGSDHRYLLTLTQIQRVSLYGMGTVTYNVRLESMDGHTIVWLMLAESTSRNAEIMYAIEMKGFLAKKIEAIREA